MKTLLVVSFGIVLLAGCGKKDGLEGAWESVCKPDMGGKTSTRTLLTFESGKMVNETALYTTANCSGDKKITSRTSTVYKTENDQFTTRTEQGSTVIEEMTAYKVEGEKLMISQIGGAQTTTYTRVIKK